MKNLKLTLVVAVLIAITSLSKAQTLGEFKPVDKSWGESKAKKVKRIFISSFFVNYQIYNEKQKTKAATSTFGGGMRGSASAEASVGLDGLSEADVQSITDKLYQDFLAKIKNAGYTLITADEAAKTKTYSDYEQLKGGKVSLAQLPGCMATAPTDYDFFVKKVSKSGKTKSGGFMGNAQFLYPGLSKELDDALIASVDLTVLFVEDKTAFQGNGVNIKIKTNLKLASEDVITMTNDSQSIVRMGENTFDRVNCEVNFYYGKMGMASLTTYNGFQKKPLTIEGVIKDEKIQSFASGGVSQGVSNMYFTYFSVRNANSKTAKIIPVDAELYKKGVYAATQKFVDYHTDNFLSKAK